MYTYMLRNVGGVVGLQVNTADVWGSKGDRWFSIQCRPTLR